MFQSCVRNASACSFAQLRKWSLQMSMLHSCSGSVWRTQNRTLPPEIDRGEMMTNVWNSLQSGQSLPTWVSKTPIFEQAPGCKLGRCRPPRNLAILCNLIMFKDVQSVSKCTLISICQSARDFHNFCCFSPQLRPESTKDQLQRETQPGMSRAKRAWRLPFWAALLLWGQWQEPEMEQFGTINRCQNAVVSTRE